MLLNLKNSDSEGAFAGIIMGEKELRGEREKDSIRYYGKYLYLLPADLGGAALLNFLKRINNYEKR